MPVNETDVINNAKTSEGIISKKTIVKNHPWVANADEEMDRIKAEKQAALEEYGAGLFKDSFGADDGGNDGGEDGSGVNE
jgi:hypothetical protein